MTETRELLQKLIEAERQYAKDHLEIEFKGIGYLLAANAAGLAGCATLLKDYATTPHLKGIGAFISLFGIGFVFAIIAFISTNLLRQAWLGELRENGRKEARPQLYAIGAFAPGAISCLCLCAAVGMMVARFMRL
ncbi:MAG: hypothetical protein V4477_18485 [Pseudomonadota bacterium]|jgi:hypothetical protein